jgi:hypothetical protein
MTDELGENGGGYTPTLNRQRLHTMTFRSAARLLLVLTLGLPVVQAALFWVAGLLTNMGDNTGAAVIRHVVTGCQVAWTVSIVGLVIALALLVLSSEPTQEE